METDCPHCNPTSFTYQYPLLETDLLRVVCDAHPLEEGHILIIPKEHVSCIGEYSKELYTEFLAHYKIFSNFIKQTYGSVATFEHGKFGQTVFHSHVHLLPFNGSPTEIVPEGTEYLRKINDTSDTMALFSSQEGYLFFSINEDLWSVDIKIAAPRFFRDRFAAALGKPERGNWKTMREDKELMKQGEKDDIMTQKKWKEYNATK